MKTKQDRKSLEKYSSAFTLSDMEMFIFPELLYALVLANIMSPVIWKWRDDPWFKGIEKKPPIQRLNRLKQYIMDHFVFNLDLETWGLTGKKAQLQRFKGIADEKAIAESNALFGYEGDKYYFSMDIRRHFGLDKYTDDVIPYWKTETAEAMESFKYKKDYTTGAGECVSLSALYAAAIFIIARIPLEDFFLMATPLHSQNFIRVNQGLLTNNRRLVSKNMWFNGTSLSAKARRALEYEQVTIVSHITGFIHSVYKEATIDPKQYDLFKKELGRYLHADFSPEILCNFLRSENACQRCFQFWTVINGKKYYIEVERIYQYEHSSPTSFSTDSRSVLLNEIEMEEFKLRPIPGRIMLNDVEEYIRENKVSSPEEIDAMINKLMIKRCRETDKMFDKLIPFIHVIPKLPPDDKDFVDTGRLDISLESSRDEIINYIRQKAGSIPIAELALYAYRDMERIDWRPFIQAALLRNPVSIEGLKDKKTIEEVFNIINNLPNESIYPEKRAAQPDEVWNFQRGDGIEKALLFANILRHRFPDEKIKMKIQKKSVKLSFRKETYEFLSAKGLELEEQTL